MLAALLGLIVYAGPPLRRWAIQHMLEPPKFQGDPRQAAFVPPEVCTKCHQAEQQLWQESDHSRSMQVATAKTILGDFKDAAFDYHGIVSSFYQRDGKFFAKTDGPDGELREYEIKYTFGFFPLQQYLVEFPGGRLQCLSIAWDSRENRWFHLYPNERITHEDSLHWTRVYQNWNFMCAECHSTNLWKNFDPKTDTYRTTWSEIQVGCQACHGPGSVHVAWAEWSRANNHKPGLGEPKGLLVSNQLTNNRAQVESCAPCHARRHQVCVEPKEGDSFFDAYLPETLRRGLYHPDGQILEEDYEYGSFTQTKMYQKGVGCTDCHEAHTGKVPSTGNGLCNRCHQEQPQERFPTLKQAIYDSPSHHFHKEGEKGSFCIDCHMDTKNYMVVDVRRDHSFRIPRPDLTLAFGAPNACNHCHADKSAEWAAAKVVEWYGPNRPADLHFTEAFAAAQSGRNDPHLIKILEDQELPSIIRASALESMREFAGPDVILEAARDADKFVRATAAGGLDGLPWELRLPAALVLASDKVRAVRIEAGRVLTAAPPEQIPEEKRSAANAAINEFKALLEATSDTPGAWLQYGVLHEGAKNQEEAEKAYQKALAIDVHFVPAMVNLANLYNNQGRNREAEEMLVRAIAVAPEEGELHYSMGLLEAELGQMSQALEHLETAAEKLPNRVRVRYNQALVLQKLGRMEEGENALMAANRIDPRDADVLYALALEKIRIGDEDSARRYVEALHQAHPEDPRLRDLMRP